MSRNVRDLRDLICVSRLTMRESDDEDEVISDENLSLDLEGLSVDSDSEPSKPVSESGDPLANISPDSGVVTNGSPLSSQIHIQAGSSCKKPKPKGPRSAKKKKKKTLGTFPDRHDLLKSSPLPPVLGGVEAPHPPPANAPNQTRAKRTSKAANVRVNFDELLSYMDATVVADWLTRANKSVTELSQYIVEKDNFVEFSHFWLTEFPDSQKREIFEMEHELLMEELGLAFAVGRDSRKVSQGDLHSIIGALFREYPEKIIGPKGKYLFLDYLDIFSCERTTKYKALLSDVKCSTRNKQYAQWLLATRSFTLVNIWSAVVNFYRHLYPSRSQLLGRGLPLPSSVAMESVHYHRLHQSIQLGYVDVLDYLIQGGHVDPHKVDFYGRTLVFTAVMQGKPDVVRYLIEKVKPSIDVNIAADTGNTPLHAASNNGSCKLVKMLLKAPKVNVNAQNQKCENAMPLHLAVMHGHASVVQLLLAAGAHRKAKMGDTRPIDMARDFGHDEILQLFSQ